MSKRKPTQTNAIATEVERIYENAAEEDTAVELVHTYLKERFQTSQYPDKSKGTIEYLLYGYAHQLITACGMGIWEELTRLSTKLEKLIVQPVKE